MDTERSPSANSRKRRQSDEVEQESKRQRRSPGKSSPVDNENQAAEKQHSPDGAAVEAIDGKQPGPRRKGSAIVDEKQRSKRLFGSLLGNLNQPRDRTSKRREEIEARRKAELQRQDDERLEDKQRRLEKLAEQRKRAQEKVDEDNMRLRHANMLNTANFLQTTIEPRLYYRPWELLPDEEDRIDEQVKDAQAQVDREVVVAEGRPLETKSAEDEDAPMPGVPAAETASEAQALNAAMEDTGALDGKCGDGDDQEQAEAKSASEDTNSDKPATAEEVDVDGTTDTHNTQVDEVKDAEDRVENNNESEPRAAQAVVEQQPEEDEDHIVEGDEDTVIY